MASRDTDPSTVDSESQADPWIDANFVIVVTVVALVVLAAVLLVPGTDRERAFDFPNAEVDVQTDAAADTLTVTWIGNQPDDEAPTYLLVQLKTGSSVMQVAETTKNTTVTDQGVRLHTVGEQVTYVKQQPNRTTDDGQPPTATNTPADRTVVEVVVVAVNNDNPAGTPTIEQVVVFKDTIEL